MKKICLIIVICLALVGTQITAFAASDDIKVKVNGELVKFDVKPFVENGRTLVPIRSIAEALKFKVDWNGNTSTATLSKGDSVVKLVLDSDVALVNGKEVKMDVTATSKAGRTVVPLRFVSESLGCTVDWFEANKIAAINEKTADGKEVLLFTRLLQSEEYEPVDYTGYDKGYSYAPRDKRAKFRILSFPARDINGKMMYDYDMLIQLYEYDKYTRDKVKEVLKTCFPKDYDTVYMYLVVTLRKEVYEFYNELEKEPGVNCTIHNNRTVYTTYYNEFNFAMVGIYAEGYKPKPEWFRYKLDPEFFRSSSDKYFIEKWNLNEYTVEDYKKVRGNVYKYIAYKRGNYKLYTYGETAPPGVTVENSYEKAEYAVKDGYSLDDFWNLYIEYYDL